MCYCNYLNDREDYCGSEACNRVAHSKGFHVQKGILGNEYSYMGKLSSSAVRINNDPIVCNCIHNCQDGKCRLTDHKIDIQAKLLICTKQ